MKCLRLVIIFEWCFPAKKNPSNCLHIPSPALHVLLLVQLLTQAQNKRGNKRGNKRVCCLFIQMYRRIQKLHLAERSKSTSSGLGLAFHFLLCALFLPGADWGKVCPTQFKFRKNQKNPTFPCSFRDIFQCNCDLYHGFRQKKTWENSVVTFCLDWLPCVVRLMANKPQCHSMGSLL